MHKRTPFSNPTLLICLSVFFWMFSAYVFIVFVLGNVKTSSYVYGFYRGGSHENVQGLQNLANMHDGRVPSRINSVHEVPK